VSMPLLRRVEWSVRPEPAAQPDDAAVSDAGTVL
jgi:hypothetical protein